MQSWWSNFSQIWVSSPESWAGVAGLEWALVLALAALGGYAFQRRLGLPRVLGYAAVGMLAGLFGFGQGLWPLEGAARFIIELGAAVVLFECGGRLHLMWLRRNPMVLVQSLLEASLAYFAVFWTLKGMGLPALVASPLGLIAMAASPILLSRISADMHSAGSVTDRALALSTLSTLYALTLGMAKARLYATARPGSNLGSVAAQEQSLWDKLEPMLHVLHVLGASVLVALVLYGLIRLALRLMSPLSENTVILVLALICAAAVTASILGGSAPLAALLGGMLLRQFYARPLPWGGRLGPLSTLVGMVMFVLVACAATQTTWSGATMSFVMALISVRLLAKAIGVGAASWGSATSWRQTIWTAGAMAPLSVVALLITASFGDVVRYSAQGSNLSTVIVEVALPSILLMELLGALLATWTLRRSGEARNTLGVRHDA